MSARSCLQAKTSVHVLLQDIFEIRRDDIAVGCKQFRESPDVKLCDPTLALTVLHGTEFRLQQLCVIFESTAVRDAWFHGLNWLSPAYNKAMYATDKLTEVPQWGVVCVRGCSIACVYVCVAVFGVACVG